MVTTLYAGIYAFMQASQGSSYPWWLVAMAKRNLLLRECVGRWW